MKKKIKQFFGLCKKVVADKAYNHKDFDELDEYMRRKKFENAEQELNRILKNMYIGYNSYCIYETMDQETHKYIQNIAEQRGFKTQNINTDTQDLIIFK